MKLLSLTSVLLLVAISNGQEYTRGIRRTKSLFRLINLFSVDRKFDLDMADKCAGKMGPVCFNKNILLTCISGQVFNKFYCKSINPAKPYCEKSACTNKKQETFSAQNKFRCTSVGLFPNPDDCASYYQCMDIYPHEAEIFDCPKNYVYDSKVGMCKRKRLASDCRTISCSKKSNTYKLFASDKSILVFCSDILGEQETILFRCPHYYDMEYDPNTFECKYSCTKEGYFADPDVDNKYYVCYKDGSRYEADHMSCPNGFWFDPIRKACSMRSGNGGGENVQNGTTGGNSPSGTDVVATVPGSTMGETNDTSSASGVTGSNPGDNVHIGANLPEDSVSSVGSATDTSATTELPPSDSNSTPGGADVGGAFTPTEGSISGSILATTDTTPGGSEIIGTVVEGSSSDGNPPTESPSVETTIS